MHNNLIIVKLDGGYGMDDGGYDVRSRSRLFMNNFNISLASRRLHAFQCIQLRSKYE